MQDSRIFGSIVKDEIAEIINDGLAAVVVDTLQSVGMATNDNIGAGVEVIFGCGFLDLLETMRLLGAPVNNRDDVVAISLGGFNSIDKLSGVVTE